MSTTNHTGKKRGLLRRGAFATVAAGAAALVVTTAAPPAHAQEAEAAIYLADVMFQGVIQGLEGEGIGMLFSNGSSSTVTISQIQSAITSALQSTTASNATTAYNTLVADTSTYYRGSSCDDLSTAESNVSAILGNSNSGALYVTQQLASCGHSCASLYPAAGLIYVSFEKELYEIYQEQTLLGCSGHTYTEQFIANQLNAYTSAAATVLAQMKTNESTFDAQFTSTQSTERSTQRTISCGTDCSCTNDAEQQAEISYCMPYTPYGGSATYLCPNASLSITSSPASSWGTSNSYEYLSYECEYMIGSRTYWTPWDVPASGYGSSEQQAFTTTWMKTMKPHLRDQQIGTNTWAVEAALAKIVAGAYSYCGDGVCTVNEVGSVTNQSGASTISCAYSSSVSSSRGDSSKGTGTVNGDCASTDYAMLDYSGGLTYGFSTSTVTLLSLPSSGLSLNWGDGYLFIKNSLNTWVWDASYWQGQTLTLSPTGNITIVDASNNVVFETDTTQGTTSGNNPLPQTLVLMADGLHLMDNDWAEWWSSASDWNSYADLEADVGGQTNALAATKFDVTTSQSSWVSQSAWQCWTPGTILLANDNYNLVFETTGHLVAYQIDGSAVWTSSASGAYACNEDGGDVVMFDSSGNQVWTTNTGFGGGSYNWDGFGVDIVLSGEQLRLVAASGEPIWSTTTCEAWQPCSFDDAVAFETPANVSTLTAGIASSSSEVDVLTNQYAKLTWQNGRLCIVDLTPELATINGTVQSPIGLWCSGTGTTLKWLSSTNQLVVESGSTVVSAYPSSSNNSGSNDTLNLAGCNFFVGAPSDNAAVYSSQSACTYNTNGNSSASN